MKVEGVTRKRNISIQYDMGLGGRSNPLSEAELLLALTLTNTNTNTNTNTKELRRLPHVFSKVLQLPLSSDADVSVEECPHFFRFVADAPGVAHVQASTFELHPGLTKVVVTETETDLPEFCLDEFEFDLDIWRFRLPESTRPELATAVLIDGELIVTVPKGHEEEVLENRGVVDSRTLVLVK